MTTANKGLNEPVFNSTSWDVALNENFDWIDDSLGAVTSLNATSGSATLTVEQYRAIAFNVTGALTGNVTYEVPSGVGGMWVVRNATTEAFTVTIASAGAGTSVAVTQGTVAILYSDGTNIRTAVDVSIADNSVTNAKLAEIDTQRLKGRSTAATGDVEDITIEQALEFLSAEQGAIATRTASEWEALLPGTEGLFLMSGGEGANASWSDPLPTQTDNGGKFLTTDGTDASWAAASPISARGTVTNGTSATCTVSGAVNVASVTQSFGSYTVTFTTALSDANYQVLANRTAPGANTDGIVSSITKTTTQCVITFARAGAGGIQAVNGFDFCVFGGN